MCTSNSRSYISFNRQLDYEINIQFLPVISNALSHLLRKILGNIKLVHFLLTEAEEEGVHRHTVYAEES